MITITDVKVRKVEGEGKYVAWGSFTIDDCFVIKDVRVVQGQNGLFVAMPSRRKMDGEFIDIAHPITTEARELIQRTVLEEYVRMIG